MGVPGDKQFDIHQVYITFCLYESHLCVLQGGTGSSGRILQLRRDLQSVIGLHNIRPS